MGNYVADHEQDQAAPRSSTSKGWHLIAGAPKHDKAYDGEVLLWIPEIGPRPAFWCTDECWQSPVDGTIYTDATHWMPLPPPPESNQ
jgi:hypothetical protein